MNKMWKKTLFKVAFWLIAEIALNISGLDKLANYTEFLEKSLVQHNAQSYLCS